LDLIRKDLEPRPAPVTTIFFPEKSIFMFSILRRGLLLTHAFACLASINIKIRLIFTSEDFYRTK